MNQISDALFAELSDLVEEVGTDGGSISASIYDTAQVLRYWPVPDVRPILNWLLAQQQPDGGWGDPRFPLSRDVPTLAVLLALHQYQDTLDTQCAVEEGLDFLRRQSVQWTEPLGNDLPVAVEMNLPRLLAEAAEAGLELPCEPYAALTALGSKRRQRIAQRSYKAGDPVLYCWEAWGTEGSVSLLDGAGSVGHSPAATAAWLHATRHHPDLEKARRKAEQYLQCASAATGTGLPGVLPVVWPIQRFEQSFALHALLLGGLLNNPALSDVVASSLDALVTAQCPGGWGMSDDFAPDGDDTAACLAVLQSAGYRPDCNLLNTFRHADHFVAYCGEMQPSVSLTARAAQVLQVCGQDIKDVHGFLQQQQLPDGRWTGDKWNISWLYTTLVVLALDIPSGLSEEYRAALGAICEHQQTDGGWGDTHSSAIETAYAVLALGCIWRRRQDNQYLRDALARGQHWLYANASGRGGCEVRTWLSKETYALPRLDRIVVLCALLCTETAEANDRCDCRVTAESNAAAPCLEMVK